MKSLIRITVFLYVFFSIFSASESNAKMFDDITQADVKTVVLSSNNINGSDNQTNQIPAGAILVYKTGANRYGKMEILSYGYNLTIKWVTYNSDGSIFKSGDNLLIKGTWLYDIDEGIEADLSSDFWWEQVDDVIRYIVPKNGALFALYNSTSETQIINLNGKLAFGNVTAGSTATQTLTISNTGNSPLIVSSITYPAGFFGNWSGIIAAGSSQNVTVTFVPSVTQTYSGTVTVNSDKTDGINTIAVSGTGTGACATQNVWGIDNDNTADLFGNTWCNGTFEYPTLKVYLKSIPNLSDKLNFYFKAKPTEVKSINDYFGTYISVNGVGGYAQVVGTWAYFDISGTDFKWYTLTLPADLNKDGAVDWKAGVNDLKIATWSCYNEGPSKTGVDMIYLDGDGHISLTGNLDFGDVSSGLSATRMLKISNTGTTPLTVSSITYPPGFSGDWSGTILACDSKDISVTFTATEAKSYSGVLTVNSNNTDGTNTISVSGTGVTSLTPTDTCPTTPTIRSKANGNWSDPVTWDVGRVPNENDVVQIEPSHTVIVASSKVNGVCNFGTLTSKDSDMKVNATDFIYNYNTGTIKAADGKNSECPAKNNPTLYKHPTAGNSIFLQTNNIVNEGLISGGKGGNDSTWLCLSDSDAGKWSYPVVSTDGMIRLHKSEKGTWGLQLGETQYGFPSVGGEGGKVEIRPVSFTNKGFVKGGKGGYGDSSSGSPGNDWGDGVHGVSIGGKGGEVIVTPSDLANSANMGKLIGGCGGDSDIPGCWATGDIACNANNINPSRPGNGGNVTFNAAKMLGIINGCKGSTSSWDPTTLKVNADTRFEGSDHVEIYGREDWIMDLTGLTEGAIKANKTVTISVGRGGTIDLRGLKGKVFQAAEKVEFFADTILRDNDVTVQDLAQSAIVTVAPGKILYRVALSTQQQLIGKAGETLPIQLSVFNNGSSIDTYVLKAETSDGWQVGNLPGAVTIDGLSSVQLPIRIMLSSAPGDNGVITITATSQNDPQVRTIAAIRVATEDTTDSDGDGIADNKDIFPNDPKEWMDSDKDGIGNNTDTDNDNDGMPDEWEKRYNLNPLVSDASTDSDKDGSTNLQEYKADTDPNDSNSKPPLFNAGIFTVDDTGIVKIDWLYDGGRYQGEFGIFDLAGMDAFTPGSPEFIAEAVKRVLSNSEQGYLVFSDLSEGSRFSGILGNEIKDWNAGTYKGLKSFAMPAGTQFATILVPNSTFASLAQNTGTTDTNKRPLFSLVSANPAYGMSIGQMADVNGMGKAYSYEDKDAATSDKDFNDLIVMITGATADLPLIDDLKSQVVTRSKRDGTDWRTSELGRTILAHVESPAQTADTLSMTVTLNAPATLLVYDFAGKVIGKDGGWIAGATFEMNADGTQTVTLPMNPGSYRVAVQGAATADGMLTVKTYQGSAEISSSEIPVDIAPHQILTTEISADTQPLTIGSLNAAMSYDFNGDGTVDNTDVGMLVKHWNSCKGQQKYDAFFDVNDDGCITVADIMTVLNAKTVN